MINGDRLIRDVIVIGASAGGVEALIKLFSELPRDFQAIVGAVLHRSPLYNLNLGPVLGRRSTLTLREPHHGERLERGTVYLAPRDHHMVFTKTTVELNRGPKAHFTRPAIDPLFTSAAEAFGSRVVGVLLTGGGADGVSGLVAIKAASGLSLIQDPDEAKMPSMPMNALAQDDVDLLAPLSEIPSVLGRLARGEPVERPPRREPQARRRGATDPQA